MTLTSVYQPHRYYTNIFCSLQVTFLIPPAVWFLVRKGLMKETVTEIWVCSSMEGRCRLKI